LVLKFLVINNKNLMKDYLIEYNNLISNIKYSKKKFDLSFFSSPTLNKQESITFLYKKILKYIKNEDSFTPINLKEKFKFIFRILYHFFFLSIISLLFRVKKVPKNNIYIRTWLVPRSIKSNNIVDDYFKELVTDLSLKNKVIVAFQHLSYNKLIYYFKKKNKKKSFIIPIGFLSVYEIFNLLIQYIFQAKIRIDDPIYFKNKKINDVINNSLLEDYYRCRSLQAYIDYHIAIKLKKYDPKKILYVFENQAWENSYINVFNDSKTELIGYQSSGFSFRFLNFFPSKIDKKFGLFPDKIFTVGDNYTQNLKKYGNYPIPIISFGALRFNHLLKNQGFKIKNPNLKILKKILYAFPVHFYQYNNVIKKLIKIFKNTDIQMYLKFHPLYDINDLKIKLPDNFHIIKSSANLDLNKQFDIVLFNDNSFGIETLIDGVKSYQFIVDQIYNEDRFINFNIYDPNINIDKLKILCHKLINNKFDKRLNTIKILEYIELNYKPYNKKTIDKYII
tara:strand:+ start:351 stop:1868 length:1518 start_codon:yes stop_codon:yes gene_type:complete